MLRKAKSPRKNPKPRTEAQEIAYRAFRLRGLFYMTLFLTGDRRVAAAGAVDAELEILGVEAESVRCARRRNEFESRLSARDDGPEFEDLPF